MGDKILKKLFIFYICLTLVEYGLLVFGGSLLKFYGYIIIFIWILLKKSIFTSLKKNKELIFLYLYLLLVTISLLWSLDTEMGSYYVFSMANMGILILIASTLQWNKKDVNQLLTAFQFAAAIFSFFLIVKGQNFNGTSRATLTIGGEVDDPNNLAAILIIPILISIWKILNSMPIIILNKKYLILNYIFIFLGIGAMLILGSRGGLLGLFSGTLFMFLFNNRYIKNKKNSKKIFVIKSLIIVAAIIFFIIPYIDPTLLHRLTYSKIEQDKGSNRLIIWSRALNYISTAPNFGIGIGSFQGITQLGVHNQFLIVLVESGFVGLILFSTFLIILFKKNLKSNTSLLNGILIATLIVVFFLDAYNKKFFWNAILISIIILRMERNEKLRSFRLAIKTHGYSYL